MSISLVWGSKPKIDLRERTGGSGVGVERTSRIGGIERYKDRGGGGQHHNM